MKKPLMFLIAFLFITITSSAQDKDYTDGKGNGYFWLSLNINYNSPLYNPKYDLLNIMLIHYNWQKNSWNEDYLIDCRDEITRLLSEDKTESTSFDTVIEKIDSFYTDQSTLPIPIVNAYCYCIKEIAGAGKDELSKYKNELMERYKN